MRKLIPLAALALTAAATAQSPLSTVFAANNGGGIGGGVYFDLTVGASDIAIAALSLNSNVAPGTGSGIEVYVIANATSVGNQANPAPWGAPVATGSIVAEDLDTPSFCALDASFTLTANTTYAVAITGAGWAHAYTNGDGTPGIVGSGTNQTYANADLTFLGGSASNLVFAGGTFDPRVANCELYYVLGQGPAFAALKEQYGQGCYDLSTSLYEDFAAGTLDLRGTNGTNTVSVLLIPNGAGGYTTAVGSSNWLGDDGTGTANTGTAPAGTAPISAPLVIGDDDTVAIDLATAAPGFSLIGVPGTNLGPQSDLFIGSNGFLSIDPAIDVDFTPSSAELLANASRWAPAWTDLEPNAQGSVHFDFNAGIGAAYVSYIDVPQWGNAGASSNTFQVAFFPGGLIEYRWASMDTVLGDYTIGFSTGNGATDPGGYDIYDALTQTVTVIDTGPGSRAAILDTDARPVGGTLINFVTSEIPVNVIFGAVLLSFTQVNPGIDLTNFGLAAPGCNAYIDILSNASLGLFFPAGASSATTPFGIPNGFTGQEVYAQAGLFAQVNTPNPLGVTTTNGVRLRLGDL